ncbi:Fibrinogen alpha/beta/gamma chain C-terminal globular domain [Trinorchestia longiramus]|nr:Fibrinogen alpha/beta/gamma chain C-terminal globular domain [Trinorchestia longiramus]
MNSLAGAIHRTRVVYDQETPLEDPVYIYSLEHPNSTLPPWDEVPFTDVNPSALQSDLKQVKEDLVSKISELKEDGEKLRTSIEDSTGATQTQITSLKTQVFQKIHEIQNELPGQGTELLYNYTSSTGHFFSTCYCNDNIQQVSRLGLTVTAEDCQDLFELGYNATGVYYLQKFGRQVHCDMETDDGGWLVIQRRVKVDPQVNFDQSWHTYKKGFGDLESEFWIGNEFLHVLTNQKAYRLAVDMVDYEKGAFVASYSSFRVGNEASLYSLDLGNFAGNTTDAFSYHHGRPFTSNDRDNDLYKAGNCASYFSGGWWYENCYDAHLNGVYPEPPDRLNATFITWWARENNTRVPLVLTSVTVRVKPT